MKLNRYEIWIWIGMIAGVIQSMLGNPMAAIIGFLGLILIVLMGILKVLLERP